jgi:hypothetical protein
MKPKPYESIVHMFTIFFYVLMSLALKEVLVSPTFKEPTQKWPCFIAALLLLSRFLFGSSSHLNAEHADERERAGWFLTWHLWWLIGFALIGTAICYSDDVHDFLWWNVVFGGVAVSASLLDLIVERKERAAKWKDYWSTWWLMFNAIHTVTSYACLKWFESAEGRPFIAKWSMPLIVLFTVLAVLLWLDFLFQVKRLGEAFTEQKTSSAPLPEV